MKTIINKRWNKIQKIAGDTEITFDQISCNTFTENVVTNAYVCEYYSFYLFLKFIPVIEPDCIIVDANEKTFSYQKWDDVRFFPFGRINSIFVLAGYIKQLQKLYPKIVRFNGGAKLYK